MTTAQPAPTRTRPVSMTGPAVTLVGAGLVLVSYTQPWYGDGRGADADIGFLRRVARGLDVPALSKIYFGWLSWGVLLAVVLVGLAAGFATRAATALRGLGLVLGVAGACLTYLAVSKLGPTFPHGLGSRGAQPRIGMYLAAVGYALAGVGAAIGPAGRRVELTSNRSALVRASLVVPGALFVWLALTTLPWYDTRSLEDEPDRYRFVELKLQTLAGRPDTPPLVNAYFDWLAWTLLVTVLVLVLAAAVATRAVRTLRGVTLVAGLASAVMTYVSVVQLFHWLAFTGFSGSNHTQSGLWLAVGGFALMGLAAALGPIVAPRRGAPAPV